MSTATIDQERLDAFMGRVVGELGATFNAVLVGLGDRLGLYAAMRDGEPVTPEELARRTGTYERLVREWLNAQAAGGFVDYDADDDTYRLAPEQAFALLDLDLPGAFRLITSTVRDEDGILDAFRSGRGYGWHEHDHGLFEGTERFFRPGYQANLVTAWLPALEGVEAKLRAGARVADLGCGHGSSTILMAQAYPESTFVGTDYHAGSIDAARERAREAGVGDRVRFEVADAEGLTGGPYDVVTLFDCLHDMGDPTAAARAIRERLAPDGTLMVVEPRAGDRVEDNLNPVGRLYYCASTTICTPASLSQPGRAALGAQAGESRLSAVLRAAGFGHVRRAAETPFNMVLEARP